MNGGAMHKVKFEENVDYNLDETCLILRRDRRTVIKIIDLGRLAAGQDGGGYHIKGSNITKYISGCYKLKKRE